MNRKKTTTMLENPHPSVHLFPKSNLVCSFHLEIPSNMSSAGPKAKDAGVRPESKSDVRTSSKLDIKNGSKPDAKPETKPESTPAPQNEEPKKPENSEDKKKEAMLIVDGPLGSATEHVFA